MISRLFTKEIRSEQNRLFLAISALLARTKREGICSNSRERLHAITYDIPRPSVENEEEYHETSVAREQP
jgi:hypothetical protein